MKIRTITLNTPDHPTPNTINRAGKQLAQATEYLVSLGYSVQTRRLAFRHWDTGLGELAEGHREELLHEVEALCAENDIELCSVGMVRTPPQIEHVASILAATTRLSASADAGSLQRGIDVEAIRAAAKAVRYLAFNSEGGFGNFRFGAGFCLSPGMAFFPGPYNDGGPPSFAIGLENSDLLVKAFSLSGSLERAREALFNILLEKFRLVEEAAIKIASIIDVRFGGLDTSIAPSLDPEESIDKAFQAVNVEFGASGTLAVCGAVTDVVKSLPVKQVGYCGIMLPVLEDVGLAQAVGKGTFGITNLLAYSSVCGVGVDMVPIPGNVPLQSLENLMLDVGTMAIKLKKPLSVRVLPIAGKLVGEKTQFTSPLLCNSQVMEL